MIFISLVKSREKPTKEALALFTKWFEDAKKKGIKIMRLYWTLGRYDGVIIFEAPSEKDAMKLLSDVRDGTTTETMVAVSREDAIKMFE